MDDGQSGAISTSDGGRNPKLGRLLIIQGLCSDWVSDCGEKAENSAVFLEQELSHCGIFRQTDRSVVGVCGLTLFPKTLQEVSANSPVRLIVRHSVRGNRVQNGESCFWSLRFRNCGGISDSRAERGRYADQLFVKQCYRSPVGPVSVCTLRMYRLNCSFELKPAGATALETLGEMTFRLFD